MDNITIRRALPDEYKHFAELFVITAPELMFSLFGDKIHQIAGEMFKKKNNYFSYQHTYFIEYKNRVAGMVVGFDYREKKRERNKTIFQFMKHMKFGFFSQLPTMLKGEKVIGQVKKNDFYFSNLAVYPEFRGMGLGKILVNFLNDVCKKKGYNSIVAETYVEKNNVIDIFISSGYDILYAAPTIKLKGNNFNFVIVKNDLNKINEVKELVKEQKLN